MSSEIDIAIANILESRKELIRRMLSLRNQKLYWKYKLMKSMKDNWVTPQWSLKELDRKLLVAETDTIKAPLYSRPKLKLSYTGETTILETIDNEQIEVPYVPQFVYEAAKLNQRVIAYLQGYDTYVELSEPIEGLYCVEDEDLAGNTIYQCYPQWLSHAKGEFGEILLPQTVETYDGFAKLVIEAFTFSEWVHGAITYDTTQIYFTILVKATYRIRVVDIASGSEQTTYVDGYGVYVSSTDQNVKVYAIDSYLPLQLNPNGIYSSLKAMVLYQGRLKRLVASGV